MALFKFTNAILKNKNIDIYNNGELVRDFTYITDVTKNISGLIQKIEEGLLKNRHYIYNVGSENPIPIMKYINILEKTIGKPRIKTILPKQLGDVLKTSSNSSNLYDLIGFKPKTKIEDGISNFFKWFKAYHKI